MPQDSTCAGVGWLVLVETGNVRRCGPGLPASRRRTLIGGRFVNSDQEGRYLGGGISISQNFPKSFSILFYPLESSISKQALRGFLARFRWEQVNSRAVMHMGRLLLGVRQCMFDAGYMCYLDTGKMVNGL
jgi:hypothetical protein